LRAVPIVAAIASTATLAYFLISERWLAEVQSQQPQQQAMRTAVEPLTQQAQEQLAESTPEAPPQEAPLAQQQQVRAEEPEPPVPDPLPGMPNDDKLVVLINSALLALNQANETGNYTVLYDMAAPGLKKKVQSPERLAQVFADLRSRQLDLSPVLLFQPKLYRKPAMNEKGMIRITGFFPTSPERVNFDLVFQPVQGRWRLYGIAASTQQAPPQAGQTPQGTSAPAPEGASLGKPAAAEVTKPLPPKKPAAKPKPTVQSEEPAQVDVRDRIDNPPAPPPAEKPKPKNSIWNPFGR
jgi:hypothetical protein